MSMAELVAAGAPELPDGWFYRVSANRFGWPEVQIRERRKRFGSRGPYAYALVRFEDFETAEQAVAAACRVAFDRLEADETYRRKLRAASTYIGDHDPKGGRG